MRYLLPLLFLACASPAEYQRGTFTPPPPAPVRTGVGAPVVGQPGMQPRTIPRGADRRVLPPTREPGIWASDKPLGPDGYPLPFLLGYELPIPPDAVTPIEREAPTMCAKMMATAALSIDAQHLSTITPAEKRCLAARLYDVCAAYTYESMLKAARDFTFYDAAMEAAFKKTALTAREHLKTACEGVPVTRDTEEALSSAVAAFMRATRGEQ